MSIQILCNPETRVAVVHWTLQGFCAETINGQELVAQVSSNSKVDVEANQKISLDGKHVSF